MYSRTNVLYVILNFIHVLLSDLYWTSHYYYLSMTSTAQATRKASEAKTASTTTNKEWMKLFQVNKVNTELKSLTFVKKLLTISLSNITYLRSMFNEDAYADKSLQGIRLKILKEKSGNEEGELMSKWLLGAFDAIERSYLKELVFFVYFDPDHPEDVYEKYTFNFSYNDGKASFNFHKDDGNKTTEIQMANIMDTTRSLLRNLVVITQGLKPLPDSAYLSMKLAYYDEVTPMDYEPEGFGPSAMTEKPMPRGSFGASIGQVGTSFHSIKLKVDAAGQSEMEEDVMVNNNYVSQESQSQSQMSSSPLTILCICKNSVPDDVMLTCQHCNKRQHGACYRILSKEMIPSPHFCLTCSNDDTRPCTDPKLVKMKEKGGNVGNTCLFRRVLVALRDCDTLSEEDLANKFNLDREWTAGIIGKLVKEGILEFVEEEKNYKVRKEVLETEGFRRYLGTKPKDKFLDQIVSKTGHLNLENEGSKGKKRPSEEVSKEGDVAGGVSRLSKKSKKSKCKDSIKV